MKYAAPDLTSFRLSLKSTLVVRFDSSINEGETFRISNRFVFIIPFDQVTSFASTFLLLTLRTKNTVNIVDKNH